MYVITGANGQTGSVVARTLLDEGQAVRVILRQAVHAPAWRARGADVRIADVADPDRLCAAFAGARAAYLMNPPAYQADDLLARASTVHRALIAAAEQAGIGHVVALSSVGAQRAQGTGNILTTHDFESRLAHSRLAVGVLRAANFIENWAGALHSAISAGTLPSMFQPLERRLPMVSAIDIGRTAAAMLQQAHTGIIELHGPAAYSPDDAAADLERIVDRPVRAVAVPRAQWADHFRAAGHSPSATAAFCEMFEAFNDGRVAFEGTHPTRHGVVPQAQVLAHLLEQARRR